jgi:CheY-like chemotaxis protein
VHIVIVDDEAAVRDSLSRTLRFEGYTVSIASDGARALELIRAEKPDGVILDVMMPVLNGLDSCRVLRAEGNFVPVLMLTARGELSDRVAGLDAGADDYLAKPFALQAPTTTSPSRSPCRNCSPASARCYAVLNMPQARPRYRKTPAISCPSLI